jgi:uncharacterized heparinase superfamily protein
MVREASGPGTVGRRLKGAVARRLFKTRLYDASLGAAVPSAFVGHVEDPWPGVPEIANKLFQGRYDFFGEQHAALNEPPWDLAASDTWRGELHGFAWLRHFRAAGGEAARLGGRELIRTWIERHNKWTPLVWRGDVLGCRLAAWSAHAVFLMEGAEPTFRQRFLASFAKQSKHLFRTGDETPEGGAYITAILGMVASALALDGEGAQLSKALGYLKQALAQQILADGTHISRNPMQHVVILEDLVFIRAALRAGGAAAPEALDKSIALMAPMVRLWRHGDGGLGLFNGGGEMSAKALDAMLAHIGDKSKTPESAPQGGFERLAAGATLILFDAGGPPPPLFAGQAHAGPLAFEMSVGRERLIVNCGSHLNAEWQAAGRATAAHSTLTLDDTNAVELEEPGGVGKRRCTVACMRNQDDGNIWIESAHDGYASFGVVHARRLYLGANGGLKGEDTLSWQGGKRRQNHGFCIRFHLHPGVQASLVRDGDAVLLRLPKGGGFRFHAGGARLSLDESIYLGAGDIRRSEQIVLTGELGADGSVVKWALAPLDA